MPNLDNEHTFLNTAKREIIDIAAFVGEWGVSNSLTLLDFINRIGRRTN